MATIKVKKIWANIILYTTLIIIGILAFTFYKLANNGAIDFLAMFGIENIYMQGGIILLAGLIILILLGVGGTKAIDKVIKR